MHLDPRSFLPQAQALRLGDSDKVAHDCGSGQPMHIRHTPEGWGAYCHRCKLKGWVFKPTLSLAERLAIIKDKQAADSRYEYDVALPEPREYDHSKWPLSHRVWLYKAGLSAPRCKALGIYYHEPTDRVVIPIYGTNGEVIYWQARGFTSGVAKYINPKKTNRSRLVTRHGSGGTLVLVEDYLSAVRVGEVTECWGLLGTQLHLPILNEIVRAQRDVAVWLDPDTAGDEGAQAIMRSLRRYGINVRNIGSTVDPKLLSKEQIQCSLNQP